MKEHQEENCPPDTEDPQPRHQGGGMKIQMQSVYSV